MTESISEKWTVARLPVMITESIKRPEARSLPLPTLTITLRGRCACSPSAWTTSAGRRFDVRRFESGKRTKTTSLRRQFIVGSHFGAVPILGKLG